MTSRSNRNASATGRTWPSGWASLHEVVAPVELKKYPWAQVSARTSINSSVGLTAETTAVGGSTRCTPSGPTSTRMGWPVCGQVDSTTAGRPITTLRVAHRAGGRPRRRARGRCTRGLRSQVPAVPHRRWVDRHTGGGMAGGGHSRRPRLRQRRPGGRQMLRRSNAVAYHHQQCPGDAREHDEPRLGPTRSAPSVGARAACVHGRRRPPSAAARGRLLPGSLIARTRHQGKEPT